MKVVWRGNGCDLIHTRPDCQRKYINGHPMKGVTIMMCEQIWLQVDLANAAKTMFLFSNYEIQHFWVYCSVLS